MGVTLLQPLREERYDIWITDSPRQRQPILRQLHQYQNIIVNKLISQITFANVTNNEIKSILLTSKGIRQLILEPVTLFPCGGK